MALSKKVQNISTIISFVAILVFSLAKTWQTMVNLEVLGEQQDHDQETALVARVIDGDTIELADGRKLRYIGIDTPELGTRNQQTDCFASEAAEYNRQLVEGETVTLEVDVGQTDRYGRLLRYVWLNEQMVNQVLVEQGYAYAVSYPPDVKYQDSLQAAQQEAQEQRAGLWGWCATEGN